jgi:hypothetical protein
MVYDTDIFPLLYMMLHEPSLILKTNDIAVSLAYDYH